MCPGPWQRDTICRANVGRLTAAADRSRSAKSSDFQSAATALDAVAPYLLPLGASGSGGGEVMLLPEQVQRLVELALAEFAPEWQVTGLCSELNLHNPDHWVSGLGTFGLVLRNRKTRIAKVSAGGRVISGARPTIAASHIACSRRTPTASRIRSAATSKRSASSFLASSRPRTPSDHDSSRSIASGNSA